ncbi:lysophospholipid acyltransferase family protein [Profundibacterium mesophilum]|uniref:1-acyl-sn-glycerol-3-phosphate acyltransferase n=1 Tax=Profundibacterium mesophilum KAUST100406-0324 TaxID=1037889 RepID=A0A921TDP6_9RHOB|nr:lysophospholipid acyltransferase family protein [Profundibacterium mesophilum]KAF0676437.1 1-acyl-sn-glycerol-3-phosphate acyltransferase [Profundibacterium mesophilum KAUST100406-0324]
MANAVQWLRSLLFNTQMYVMMPLMALVFLPYALVSRQGAFAAVHTYCRYVRWTASWMVGLRSEIRGTPPTGKVIVAAKHQSFFDIIMIVSVLPRPRFIMKKELRYAPVLGWFALRMGCIPVDRGKRARAISQMLRDVAAGSLEVGQLIIYPQGTRLAPGVSAPFKSGTTILYRTLAQPCVPVAVNVGLFWPRQGVMRRKGLAVVEFLPVIPPGLDKDSFARRLSHDIESHSDRLMAEAGFTRLPPAP